MNDCINGSEAGLPQDTPLAALAAFYSAFNGRDLRGVMDSWLDDDCVSMSNPLGGVKRGRDALAAVYGRIFSGSVRVQVEFHDFTVTESGSMFCAVGRERGWCRNADRELLLAIRTTRVFLRHANRWRQVHHHGSIDDPQLLSDYQLAATPPGTGGN